jgi:hypothetical protein
MKTCVCLAIALALLLGACNYPAGGADPGAPPQAWIDRPLDGSQFLLGDSIPIQWHASGDQGLRRVEVHANGQVLDVADAQEGDLDPDLVLVEGEFDWSPAEAGEYLIQVLPTGPDDAEGAAAENRVQVFAQGGTVAGLVSADHNRDGDSDDAGEGPVEGATVVVADCGEKRSQVTTADGTFSFSNLPLESCTMDVYRNGWFFVGTFPADLDFPIHFSPRPDEPISLTVFLGQEPTPTPTATPTAKPTATRIALVTAPPVLPPATMIPTAAAADTQPPPAPAIVSPKDAVILGCLTNIVLLWQAVEDASGIDNYAVALAVSYNNGASWSGVGDFGLEFTTIQINDQTDCGNLYRWRVRARDNAGNIGPWSPWERFGIGID